MPFLSNRYSVLKEEEEKEEGMMENTLHLDDIVLRILSPRKKEEEEEYYHMNLIAPVPSLTFSNGATLMKKFCSFSK